MTAGSITLDSPTPSGQSDEVASPLADKLLVPLGEPSPLAARPGCDAAQSSSPPSGAARPRALGQVAPRRPEPYVILPAGNPSLFYRAMKRLLDILGALAILALIWPVMLATLIVLTITTKGKPIFCQERVGLCGRKFWMYKFRTMYLDADKRQKEIRNEKDGPIFKNRHDPRITPIGRWLRSTSIDETPQLFHVLWGQMSLVGPRPPVPKEVEQYEPWQRRRLTVKPGLTCLWQVSGRSEIGFEDWVRMDLWYRKNQKLSTDLELLAKTPWSVITRKGAY